jgi:hypothetical protein
MTDILNGILANLDTTTKIVVALTALIGFIGALVYAAIAEYLKLKKLLAKGAATDTLKEFMAPYIATAEDAPHKIYEGLQEIPTNAYGATMLKGNAGTNDSKALLVAQASIEAAKKKKPSILKTLGNPSAADLVSIVSGLYGLIKPSIKRK